MQHAALLFSHGHLTLESAGLVGLSVNLSVSQVKFIFYAPEQSICSLCLHEALTIYKVKYAEEVSIMLVSGFPELSIL